MSADQTIDDGGEGRGLVSAIVIAVAALGIIAAVAVVALRGG